MDILGKVLHELQLIKISLVSNKKALTLEEVSIYTGLSKSYLYKLTSAGMIPHYKPQGKQLFFAKEELDNWLLSNKAVDSEHLETLAADHMLESSK